MKPSGRDINTNMLIVLKERRGTETSTGRFREKMSRNSKNRKYGYYNKN